MHKANHPHTKHYCENVWEVDPVKACKGHPVGLAWFSPDCKHFSKAKGGKPVEKINRFGEAVEFYASAREAARQNFMSYQTIIDRCNGKCKSAFAPDGYAYVWDD